MRTPALLSMLCIFLVTASARAQIVKYVNDDGDPQNGCTSWEDACPELQTALSLANPGDEIWVAEGTYTPDYDVKAALHTGDREATFQLVAMVSLYGGFSGTEQTLEERTGLFDQTILTGDLDGDDAPVACTDFPDCGSFGFLCIDGFCIVAQHKGENSYHVVTGIDVGTTAILDGFAVTSGNADGYIPLDLGGGMINIGLSSPTVTNCTFSGNSAGQWGGGMYNGLYSNPTVTNCIFVGNWSAHWGGGMYNHGDGSLTVTNCSFIRNAAGNRGGGMLNESSNPTVNNCVFGGNFAYEGGGMFNVRSCPTVSNCTISRNSARDGGGMFNTLESSPTLSNCTISGNFAEDGGGMFNVDNSNPTVINCTFNANSAVVGGGMCNFGESNPTLTNCTFSENWASIGGGGLVIELGSATVTHCTFRANSALFGGGMANLEFSSSMVSNSTFIGNAGDYGGGGMFISGTPTVTNCTFSGNSASLGGGMYHIRGSNPTVINCTFSGNDADNGRALAFDSFQQQDPSNLSMFNCILWNGGDEIWNNDNSKISVAYSDVQGGWPGAGNIDLDPLFFDAGFWDDNGTSGIPDDDFWVEGDYHLLPGSPCIDAADNTAVPADIVTDLGGDPRFVNDPATPDTGNPDGINPIVDMGAYEFNCVDDNGDGRVTICHIPPGNLSNARTMAVNVRALPAHLAHGDACGPCENGGD